MRWTIEVHGRDEFEDIALELYRIVAKLPKLLREYFEELARCQCGEDNPILQLTEAELEALSLAVAQMTRVLLEEKKLAATVEEVQRYGP